MKLMFDVKQEHIIRDKKRNDELYVGILILNDNDEFISYNTVLVDNSYRNIGHENQYTYVLSGINILIKEIMDKKLIDTNSNIELYNHNKIICKWLLELPNNKYKDRINIVKDNFNILLNYLDENKLVTYHYIDKKNNKAVNRLNKDIKKLIKDEFVKEESTNIQVKQKSKIKKPKQNKSSSRVSFSSLNKNHYKK